MPPLSRRRLLQGALGLGAAAAGSRIVGPWVGTAEAAVDTPHFVHIFFHGGLNALFAGCAQQLLGKFDVSGTNIAEVGSGVFTDKDTFGTFPRFALDHWAGVGLRHGDANHTVPENANGGGELAIVRDGPNCYLNELAAAMGGTSKMKAILFGQRSQDYGVYRGTWPVLKSASGEDVPLERVSNIRDALKIAGADTLDPNAPDRARLATTLAAAKAMSKRRFDTNDARLTPLKSAYDTAIASLNAPPPPPVTFDEIDAAYALGGRENIQPGGHTSFAAMLAGAELMIRALGTNVVHLSDFEPMWDFDSGVSGSASRDAFKGKRSGWGSYERIAPIRTFLDRMLNAPGRNVVVAISGEFVRETHDHGHGAGVVAAVFGKHVKQGLSYPVDANAEFASGTPGAKGFWAGIASALRISAQPFGPNPHSLLG
jgi:hypothetical protein